MTTADDIFEFAETILFGLGTPVGKTWSQREIDGFFYNQFLNRPLHLSLREARRIRMGHEEPPYPCQWNDPNAPSLFLGPCGNGSLMRIDGPDEWHIAVGDQRRCQT